MSKEVEWINDYTALITTTDEHYTEGDEVTIPPRPVNNNTLWQQFKIKLAKFFTPDYRYYSVHLEYDELDAEIIDTDPDSNTYIAEVTTPTLKHYPTGQGSIGHRVRRK